PCSNVSRTERPRAGDEAPPSGCQVQRHLRRRIEAVQQHLHVGHVARRLTDLGQLLKRDQGSRESLPNDKFVTARHRSKTGSFRSTHSARPSSACAIKNRTRSHGLKTTMLKRLTLSYGVSKTLGAPPDARGGRSTVAPV